MCAYARADASLFDPLKDSVRNITELGVAAGQSLLMWHAYFPNADVWGIDPTISLSQGVRALQHRRIHIIQGDAYDGTPPAALGLAEHSMDGMCMRSSNEICDPADPPPRTRASDPCTGADIHVLLHCTRAHTSRM